MNFRTWIGLVSLVVTVGGTPQADAGGKPVVLSVCKLAGNRAAYDGHRISVRANFSMEEHETVLFDKSCPNSWLLVGKLNNGVNVSLCGNDKLAQKYGCPPTRETGVRATFIGIFHRTRDAGIIDIESMSEVEKNP